MARKALVQCTDIIVESSVNPVTLALKLYSKEVISEGIYKTIKDKKTGDSSQDRLELILDDIKDRVSQNSDIFTFFLKVLKDLTHKDLAVLIVQKYKGMFYRMFYYVY